MNFEPLQSYLASLIDKGVPGCELIVCRDHEVLFHECMGHSDEKGLWATAPEDRYWVYSCSKPLTAAAAMQCVERGLFGLDDPVEKYLPAYRDCYTMKDGQRVPLSRPMTIRHLMTMTAGLSYDLGRESVKRLIHETDGHATTRQIAETLAGDPLSFEPGERFQYSLCLDVIGAIIEVVSGKTFRDYLRENIFDPLGMAHTDFWTDSAKAPENLAAQYMYDPCSAQVVRISDGNDMVVSSNFYSGGAGIVSCGEDLLRFCDALSCGGADGRGSRILRPETIDLMRSEQLPSFDVASSFSCTCGPDYGYALGVRTRVAMNIGAPSALGEFGWDGAAGADMSMDPTNRVSFVYMQHVRNWPPMLGTIHLQVRDILYPLLGLGGKS